MQLTQISDKAKAAYFFSHRISRLSRASQKMCLHSLKVAHRMPAASNQHVVSGSLFRLQPVNPKPALSDFSAYFEYWVHRFLTGSSQEWLITSLQQKWSRKTMSEPFLSEIKI